MAATTIATITILIFFVSSLAAEINGEESMIISVKVMIFRMLPILLITMPVLGVTGKKLAGNSNSRYVQQKARRMKLIMVNGLLLTAMAVFLYYKAQYHEIDDVFLYAQVAELIIGPVNLALIGMNIRDGLRLSGRINKRQYAGTSEGEF